MLSLPTQAERDRERRLRTIGFVIKRHHHAHMLAHHPLQLDSTNPFWSTDPSRAIVFGTAAAAAVRRDKTDRTAGIFSVYVETDSDGGRVSHEFRRILSINGIAEPDEPADAVSADLARAGF